MYDKLIADLKEDAEWAEANEWETPICLSDHIKQAIEAIETLSKELDVANEANTALYGALPKWIPVTEEPLLKVGDEGYMGYLVLANGHYEIADYTTDKYDNVPFFHVDGEYEPDVTHWMELPTPPMEDENNV